jgi:hypothetical protein
MGRRMRGCAAVRLCGRGRVASCRACECFYSWVGALHALLLLLLLLLLLFYVHVAGLEFD